MKSGHRLRAWILLALSFSIGGHEDPAVADNVGSSHAAEFQTSDRCVACHNGMVNSAGDDYSIGLDWQTSLMANSSRDPYWQASLRREALDHAPVGAACS